MGTVVSPDMLSFVCFVSVMRTLDEVSVLARC